MNPTPNVQPQVVLTPPTPNVPGWHTDPHQTHLDPLADCLSLLTRHHGAPMSAEALCAGLPKTNNLLPPSQLARAANRAGFSARLVKRGFSQLPANMLPALLLLKGRRACLLMAIEADGRCVVREPETPEAVQHLSTEALAQRYTGTLAIIKPRFRFDARTPEVRPHAEKHWFWGAIFNNWRLYRDALIAALLTNVFSSLIPLYSMQVYDRVVPNHAMETLWVLTIGVLLVLSFDFIIRTVRSTIIDTAGRRIDIQLSGLIMERVLGMRMQSRPASVGSFAANIRAFESVRDFVASATVTTLIDLPFALLFLVLLAWISPWLLVPALCGILLIIGFAWLSQSKMHQLTETTYRASAQRNASLIESLVGLEAIKTLGAESEFQRRWERATQFLAQVGNQTRLLSSATTNFSQTVQQACNILTIVLGVYLLADNLLTQGAIIAAGMLSGRAIAPFGQVAGLMMQFQSARTGFTSVDSQMQQPVERPENNSFLHRDQFNGEIEFKGVSFGYPNQADAALKKASFKIRAGEKVGIIGRVGSGKTTLEKLIVNLYQPSEGAVLVDGIDVRQIDPAELRRAVGFVAQEATLFYGTLKENITLGAPFADDAAILSAARLAGVTEFANNDPKGFDRIIGERGELLSGGQRQAVVIARALINDPPILLLDEPTANMDFQSEAQLKQRLREFIPHKTVILVTHRTPLLDLVDRILVIDQGVIVADGPKAQVMEALQQGKIGKAS